MGLFKRKYRHSAKYILVTKTTRKITNVSSDSENSGCLKFIGYGILLIIALFIVIRYWALIIAPIVIYVVRQLAVSYMDDVSTDYMDCIDIDDNGALVLTADTSKAAHRLNALLYLRKRFDPRYNHSSGNNMLDDFITNNM